ncbi:MAG: DUF3298 domain-containing protein [Clostridia bacterium]|nr:DUF3298 domain-containing protein [Clostridia bacterium]MBQ6867119.1 DUF3298 domain-containing protein [Clostridia bacterium]MBQ7094398.1 DUF3298 domain-containing protein [Clostridia bacterium]
MLYSDQLTKSVTNMSTITGESRFQGVVVLKYSVTYPSIELNQKLLPKLYINNTYLRFAQNACRYIVSNYYTMACRLYSSLDNEFEPLEISCEMSVMYENRGFLSVFFDTYERLGEVILKTRRHSDTWNLAVGKIIPIGSFFNMGANFRSIFFREITNAIEAELVIDGDKYFADWREILPYKLDFSNYYLADDGFVIFFPEYSIAPKRSGLPSFLVPYKLFGSTLRYDL